MARSFNARLMVLSIVCLHQENTMAAQLVQKSQQSSAMACADGSISWRLGAGRALTLQPREAAELLVSQGRIWATVDGPHVGPANQTGDLVLQAGERLALRPGQRVVIESWDPVAQGPAFFVWNTQPARLPVSAHSGSRWQVAVVQPLRDLRLALVQAACAGGQLLWGVAGLSEFAAAGRGRVMHGLEANQP
jgi:hypothetical protein